MFKWIFLAFALPVAASAEGTRYGIENQLDSVRVELTVSSGIAVNDLFAIVDFQTYFRDEPSARREKIETIFTAEKVERRRNSTVYTYRIAPDSVEEAAEFWRKHGAPAGFEMAFPLCRTSSPARREYMNSRISVGGFGYSPPQRARRSDIDRIVAEMEPCTAPERAD